MRCECTDSPGPVGRQCQGQLIEGELIMPQLSLCCSLIAGLLCMSLISNSSVWPGSTALLLSCHSLSLYACVCVCEALDAPSPRLCVCSHGQQGVNPLLALLLHSGSLGGIIVLHLSLPGFILIGSTPDLPKKKSLQVSHLSNPPRKPHLQRTIQKWFWDTDWCDTQRCISLGRHQPAPKRPPVAFKASPALRSQPPPALRTQTHFTSVNPPHLCFCVAIH